MEACDVSGAPRRLRGTAFWMLRRASQAIDASAQEHLAEAGLRRYAYGVLATLEEFGPAAQAEISRRLRLDPSDVVAVVGALEADGQVERHRDPADRRRNRVLLTDAGRRALDGFDAAIATAEDAFLAGLSADERAAFLVALQRLVR